MDLSSDPGLSGSPPTLVDKSWPQDVSVGGKSVFRCFRRISRCISHSELYLVWPRTRICFNRVSSLVLRPGRRGWPASGSSTGGGWGSTGVRGSGCGMGGG